jgi:hypothetical protein
MSRGEKTNKFAIKLIIITLMKIHELNTPKKYEKELEKKDSIKNHYMQ